MYIRAIESLSLLNTSSGLGDQGLLWGFTALSMLTMAFLVVGILKDGLVPAHWEVDCLPVQEEKYNPVEIGLHLQEALVLEGTLVLDPVKGEWAPSLSVDVAQAMSPWHFQVREALTKVTQIPAVAAKATVVMVEEYSPAAILLRQEEKALEMGYGSYGFVL